MSLKLGWAPVTSAVKLSVTRTRRTKPSPAHRHEKAQQSLTSPCDRQDGRRKHSHSVVSLTPLSGGGLATCQDLSLYSFFMLCMRKRKSRNPAPQVLIANKLSIVPSERNALKDIGTYYFVLQRTPSCLPLPLFPTHTHTSGIFLLLSLFPLMIQEWIQPHFQHNC